MKSLERRFKNKAKRHFGYSDYLIFCEAVKGQNFSKKTISYWFGKLVDKTEYDKTIKKSLITKLLELNNPLEEGIK